MIAVRITLNVLPEKQLEVMQTLLSLVDPVGKEIGCKSYAILNAWLWSPAILKTVSAGF